MAKVKKIVNGTVVEVEENPIVKTIVNGVVVEKPLNELKKKEVSESDLEIGGDLGISEPPLQKEKIVDYLSSLKGQKPIEIKGKPILPIQKPKKVDTKFGLSKERIEADIAPKYKELSTSSDPLGEAERRAATTKNLQESADFMAAANLVKDSLPSFYKAFEQSKAGLPPTVTNNLINQRGLEYEKATRGLREIVAPDLASANDDFIEYNIMPKIERAAVIYQISKNPSFEKELKAAGTSIDDPNLKYNLGSAKIGQIMEQFLDSPEVASFAQQEDDNLAFALQYAKDKNLERNPDWGVSSVANKVSREFERSEKRRNPIAPFATQKLKDDFDEVAREVLKPEEYKIYEEKIKGNEERYLDTPSFLTGFADEGKKIYQGFLNTAKKLTGETEKDIIREQWNKEASNVSANPEGWRNFLTEGGKMSGLVTTLAGTGNVLSGIAGGGTAKTVADAINIGTAFWGDMVDQGVMKYPGDPVKAFTSASLNTLAFLAMGKDIIPVKKVESAFKRIQPEIETVVKNLTNGSISREVAKKELNNIAKKGIGIASEGLAQNLKVSAELTGLSILNEGLDVLMDMDEDKIRKYYPTGVHGDTFKAMFLGNSLVSAVAGYGAYRVKNNTAKEAIYDAASNPKRYERVIEEMVITDPSISKQELLDNLSFAVETKRLLTERGVPESKQKDYLLKALGERVATIEKEKIADTTLKKEQEERIKQAQAEKEAILSGEEVAETPTIPLEETQLPKTEETPPQVPTAPETQKESIQNIVKQEAELDISSNQLDRLYDKVVKGGGKIDESQIRKILNVGYSRAKQIAEEINNLGVGEVAPEAAPQVPATQIAENFKKDFNEGKLKRGKEYGGGRNLGVYDYEGGIVKVVKEKRRLGESQLNLMRERLGDMDNVYIPKAEVDLGNGRSAIVMDKATGVDASTLTKEQIDAIPKEHWDKFEADIRELSKRGVAVDLTKRDNFFYNKDKGFSFIDISGISIEGGPTTKFFIKDGVEYYYKFEQYPFSPKKFEGGKKMFENIPEIKKEKAAAPVEEELPFGEVATREVAETKEERNLTKRALNLEVSTPMGEVLQYFISGGKISPEALTEFFGKERRMGMGKIRVEERRSRTSLTNKNAPSIEALAEKIAGTDRLDQVREYREAIEEALLNHSGTKTMAEELVKDYDVDFAEMKRAAELEELGREIEEETKSFVSQIPVEQQNEILKVLDGFRDNEGFINWKKISEEIESGFDPLLLELSEPSQKIINNAIKQFQETGRVGRIPSEAVRPETKAGDAARKLAERIRAGKISKEGFRASTGFDVVFDAALEVVATSLEAGASIADAIESGLKYIRGTEYYKNLTDKKAFEDKFSNKLNEEYAIQESTAGEVPVQPEARVSKEVEAGVPPTEPPVATEKGETPRKERQKALLGRIVDSPQVPESLKEKIREKGLSYVPATQAEATRLANSILDSIGIDEAVKMASNGDFSETFGGLNTAVLSEAASRLVNDPVKQAQIFDTLDTSLRSKGQDISYMNEFYTKNPEGVVIYQNTQRKNDFNKWSLAKEKQWQDAVDILKSEIEALKKELDELKAKPTPEGVRNAKAKAAAARQKRAALIQKYRQNKGGGLTLSAGGLSKEGIEFVGEVALTYIQEGIANAEVVIQKVLADLKDATGRELSKEIKDEAEQIVRKAVQEKKGKPVIDRIRKKLDGLSSKEKEDVIRKSYDKIIESGGLEIQEFKDIIAEVLGRGPLSEADAAKIKKLTVAVNEVEAKALDAQELRTEEALEAYKISQRNAAIAARELSIMFNNKPNILKRLTSFVQLSTLGIPALVNNPAYNIINQAFLRFPIGLTNTLIDRSISGVAKLTNKQFNPETNVFSRQTQAEFFKKLNLGFKEAGEQVLTGLNRQDYIQKEIYAQAIQPLESVKALFRYVKGKQKMTLAEAVDKSLQATLGVPAEAVARVLNLGDKPFRFGAEGATASEFSKALGIGKGIDYDLFIEFPKAEAYRRLKAQGLSEAEALQKSEYVEKSIIQEGKRATFQQDNFLNDKLSQLFGDEKSGVGAFLKTLTISPYIKIPSNAYWSYFNLAHPEIALLQAFVYGGKAAKLKSTDPLASKMALREARYWFAHSAVGLAYVSVISSMVASGVFTPGTTFEETKKEREGRAYYGKTGTTNVNKMMAWLRGEDPTQIKEGYAIQNKWFGHIGTLGNTIARRETEMTPEQRENRQNLLEYLISNLAPNEITSEALEGLQSGVFSNTSSIINALQSDYGLRRWGLNTINLLTNVIHPAALSQLSRAELPYYSSTKADSFMQEIKNSFLQRSSVLRKMLREQPPAKIGIWGDKLDKKDDFMMRWFGISKENPDNFAQPLYELVLRTNNIAYFPPTIKPEIEDKGKTTKLNVKQTQELEKLVGQQRKLLIAPLLNDMVVLPKYGSWSEIEQYYINEGLKKEEAIKKSDEIKVDILRNAYSLGYEFGKQFFLDNHPEFRNEDYDKGEMNQKKKIMESTRKQLKQFR